LPGDPVEKLQPIIDYTGKLTGIDKAVAVSEGFPISYRGYRQEEAETAAALLVDISETTKSFLASLGEKRSETGEVIISLANNNALAITEYENLLVGFRGHQGQVVEALKAAIRYLAGRTVSCPYCKADLTLETYTCPKCGKTVPFTAEKCPFCGTDLKVKKCPKCGRPVSSDGRKVRIAKPKSALYMAVGEGAVMGAGIGLLTGISASSTLLGVIAGVVSGTVIGYLVYKLSGEEYIVEE